MPQLKRYWIKIVVRILLRIIIQVSSTTHTPHHKHTHIQTHTCTHILITCFPLYRPRLVVYGFLKRHPVLSVRKPESLQSCRASSCTPERLDKWFADYMCINTDCKIGHNAFGMRFPLCPKTSRVLCMRNKKHVYSAHWTPSPKLLRLLQQVQQVV